MASDAAQVTTIAQGNGKHVGEVERLARDFARSDFFKSSAGLQYGGWNRRPIPPEIDPEMDWEQYVDEARQYLVRDNH